MTINKAIEMADKLRPNAIEEEIKVRWCHELNTKLTEMMGLNRTDELPEPTEADDPRDSEELILMPYPHDNIYVLYLCAMIDFGQEETALYADDMTVFNQAMSEAKAWWRRNNKNPHRHHHYKGVWRH